MTSSHFEKWLFLGKLCIGSRDKRYIEAFNEVLLLGSNIDHMVTLNLYVLFICYRLVEVTTKQSLPMKTKVNTEALMVMVVMVFYICLGLLFILGFAFICVL